MRIAVCEDDRDMCDRVEALLLECRPQVEIQRVAKYYSGNHFWFEYQADPDAFDLIVLDIELPGGIDGLEVGRKIRATGDEVTILILTAFREYAIEGYQVQPFRYLVKPVDREELLEVLLHARGRRKQARSCLNLYWQGGLVRIPFKDILYLESDDHHVLVHMEGEDEPRRFYRKLGEVAGLCDERFLHPHKSYLVNADKIATISGNQSVVLLDNGEALPISRPRKTQFMKEVMDYDRTCGAIRA